jgi:cell division septation protein DedD
LAIVTAVIVAPVAAGAAAPAAETYFGNAAPVLAADSDSVPVELGMRFAPTVDGTVSSIRFYKSSQNVGVHVGSLWDSAGKRLASATFTNESASGWQVAALPRPVAVKAGAWYVVSYLAPKGRYADDTDYFKPSATRGHLKASVGSGVYFYGTRGGFPTYNWANSNYYVDVIYTPSSVATPSASPTPTPLPTSKPTSKPTPTPTPTPTLTPTPTPAPTPTRTPSGPNPLSLPTIPWEGGSSFWSQFPVTTAAGWTKPSFFPIGIWWDSVETDANAQFDKSYGINSYIETNPSVPYSVFADNGMYWIGGKLNNTFPDNGSAWAGNFLGDEIDGKYDPPAAGLAYMKQQADAVRSNGRFSYANFTAIMASNYNDEQLRADEQYISLVNGPVSVDAYWYTDPHCSQLPYKDWTYVPVNQGHCRTASSYGKTVDSVRARVAAAGPLKPVWSFVEMMGTGPDFYISPDQIEGAAMNSVIHEARGLVYFNQSFEGKCVNGNLLRAVQVDPNDCAAANANGMKKVNLIIQSLAPVLNTQSYKYTFGPDLDSMLKWYNGSAYVFSMVSGDANSSPGARTFALPAGLTSAASVEVLNENRSIPVVKGAFTDSFAKESTFHIYRITPKG